MKKHPKDARRDVSKIIAVLNKIDPVGLIRDGAPRDEYEPEARTLLERVRREPLNASFVRDVWLAYFGIGEHEMPSGRSNYFTVYDMPMRPEFADIANRVNALFRQPRARKPQRNHRRG